MAYMTSSTGPPFLTTVESEITYTKRDAPPAHYILKIESFSDLLEIVTKTEDKKYESEEFEAGDYKWKMVVYPNGNTKGIGTGHISMYIVSTDAKAISGGCHVNVLLYFFIYDHIRDKYLTIQDGKTKRYHVLRTEYGFDRLLSLAKFNDSGNGYRANDCCVFGAEVYVIKETIQRTLFSVIIDPPNATFTWKISEFSTLQNEHYHSDTFNVSGYKWYLKLYPKGNSDENSKWLSLYLYLESNKDGSTIDQAVYAECKMLIKDQMQGKHHERTINRGWFRGLNAGWGYGNFMLLSDLKNEAKGFLVDDTLVVEAKLICVSNVRDLS